MNRTNNEDAASIGADQVNRPSRIVVAGIGSEHRRDDGAGPLVAKLATRLCSDPSVVMDVGPAVDPLDLLGKWDHADLAVIIDAVRSQDAAGTVQLLEIDCLAGHQPTSTHGISLDGAYRLARAVGSAPRRLVVVAVTGTDFANGTGLSDPVADAIPDAVDQVVNLIREEIARSSLREGVSGR